MDLKSQEAKKRFLSIPKLVSTSSSTYFYSTIKSRFRALLQLNWDVAELVPLLDG